MRETRTYVRYLYPGSFFAEEGASRRVAAPTPEVALSNSPDDGWFAAEFSTQTYERWVNDHGGEKWLPLEGSRPAKRRVYIGQRMTASEIEQIDGDHRILLSNMRSNGWATVVQTRAGNFQPVEPDDIVLSLLEVRSGHFARA